MSKRSTATMNQKRWLFMFVVFGFGALAVSVASAAPTDVWAPIGGSGPVTFSSATVNKSFDATHGYGPSVALSGTSASALKGGVAAKVNTGGYNTGPSGQPDLIPTGSSAPLPNSNNPSPSTATNLAVHGGNIAILGTSDSSVKPGAVTTGGTSPGAPLVVANRAPSTSIAWKTRTPVEISNTRMSGTDLPSYAGYLVSNVAQVAPIAAPTALVSVGSQTLSTQANQPLDYVLQMDYSEKVESPADAVKDAVNGQLYLGYLASFNGSPSWVNAANGVGPNAFSNPNLTGGTGAYVPFTQNPNTATTQITGATWIPGSGPRPGQYSATTTTLPAVGARAWANSTAPFIGSFNSFESSSNYLAAFASGSGLADLRGSWGIDTISQTVWAVLNAQGGAFAVVPEPGTIALLATGLFGIVVAIRRRRS